MCKKTTHVFKRISIVFLAAFVFFAVSARAEAADTDFTIVSTDELRMMMDEKKEFMLIDTRTSEEYREAHIVRAVSIPEKNFEAQASLLPSDKKSMIVLYCNGVKCGKSKKAAKKAHELGYRNIVIYAEGFPVWEEKGLKIVPGPDYGKKIETAKLSPYEIDGLIAAAKGDYMLVDVRDENEFSEGHIPTAVNIPVETFASFALRSETLPKEKKIIVYCNSGSRSYNAYRKLMKLGYISIGQTLFAEWKEAGMDVAK